MLGRHIVRQHNAFFRRVDHRSNGLFALCFNGRAKHRSEADEALIAKSIGIRMDGLHHVVPALLKPAGQLINVMWSPFGHYVVGSIYRVDDLPQRGVWPFH